MGKPRSLAAEKRYVSDDRDVRLQDQVTTERGTPMAAGIPQMAVPSSHVSLENGISNVRIMIWAKRMGFRQAPVGAILWPRERPRRRRGRRRRGGCKNSRRRKSRLRRRGRRDRRRGRERFGRSPFGF